MAKNDAKAVISTDERVVRATAPKMVIDRKELANVLKAELSFSKRCSNPKTENDGATYRGKDFRLYMFATEMGLNVGQHFPEKVTVSIENGVVTIL